MRCQGQTDRQKKKETERGKEKERERKTQTDRETQTDIHCHRRAVLPAGADRTALRADSTTDHLLFLRFSDARRESGRERLLVRSVVVVVVVVCCPCFFFAVVSFWWVFRFALSLSLLSLLSKSLRVVFMQVSFLCVSFYAAVRLGNQQHETGQHDYT